MATLSALRTSASRKADLARRLATLAHTPPDAAALAGLADQLDEILANESPEQAKELLRLLVKEVECTTGAGSSRPIGFRRRFAHGFRRWS